MSAFGTKRTYRVALHMSAFRGKADIAPASQNVILRSEIPESVQVSRAAVNNIAALEKVIL